MEKKITKALAVIVISVAIVVFVYMIFAIPVLLQHQCVRVTPANMITANWMGGDTIPSDFAMFFPNPEDHPPEIVYFSDNNTYQLQNPERWQEPFYIGYRMSNNVKRPKVYDDLWYIPNISVDGNKLSFDYSVYNGAKIDCGHAVYDVGMSVYRINFSEESFNMEYVTEIPGEGLEVTDIPATESRIYRITADLIQPEKDEIYDVTIHINWPNQFTDKNHKTVKLTDLCRDCSPNSLGNVIEVCIHGEEAPKFPTMNASRSDPSDFKRIY